MYNIIEVLLTKLSVPHTRHYIRKLYRLHPNRNNLLGLSQMCQHYGIKATGIKITEDELDQLPLPAILHVSQDFVLLTNIDGSTVTFMKGGVETSQDKKDFLKAWSGHALVVETAENATEPDYAVHRRHEYYHRFRSLSVAAFSVIFILYLWGWNFTLRPLLLDLLFVTDVIGVGICFLLLQKQNQHDSALGDKLCSLFQQSNCNDVLHSEKAKFLGYSWSEIGLCYFFVHGLCALLFPQSVMALSLIGWCALPYGVWSVYYQYKVKQWCIMCLMVQGLLWMAGLLSLIYFVVNGIQADGVIRQTFMYMLLFISAAWTFILFVHYAVGLYHYKQRWEEISYDFLTFKSKPEIFDTLLRLSPEATISEEDSSIVMGSGQADFQLAVLVNPHCSPCATRHKELEKLLQNHGARVSIRYLFFPFNDSAKDSCRFLIAAYQQLGEAEAREILSQWYAWGRNDVTRIMDRWPNLDLNSREVEAELDRHDKWIGRMGYKATPMIFINGHEIPAAYTLKELSVVIETA